ncbi:T9SS type A sorting domain-containing protein [Aequorivita todarodis]|uniref:T9SS type A sorting domain-containing protein n=1 Tax=Aequorivita todarodis TaxID=2036821 RepID=UPI002350AB49|nr:T9SS type A sorting domain-containing protein [Aequorivita todarodis]MDC8001809.1 T9SS type A sorting domain-containing protein [Aequorivita todarodis]
MKNYILIGLALLCGTMTNAQVPQIERDALMALYNSTDGANWVDNTNWGSGNPVSTWFGVVVENIGGTDHVTELNMEFNNLVGTIPSEIGDLSEINRLVFWSNELTGTIPPELGNCLKMKLISLEENSLSGSIPLSFANWSELEALWLNDNYLSGDITNIYESFPNLNYLGIYNLPQITGELDLSACSNFLRLFGWNTGLSTVDVRNGNNANEFSLINVTDSPNLTCIFVDDKNNIPANWQKDPTATYVETQAECDALSIEEFNSSNFNLYPNPTNKSFFIDSRILIEKVSIYDIFGKLVRIFPSQNGYDVTGLSYGMYLVNIQSEGGIAIQKLMIE